MFRNTLQIKQQASLKRGDSVRDFPKRSQYYIDNRNKQLAYSIVGSCDYMAYGNTFVSQVLTFLRIGDGSRIRFFCRLVEYWCNYVRGNALWVIVIDC
jgi:hypothetical protein